ncbi:MAG: helix-turn-helix domain-containing protein [Proteobacteria bacterium]|nr:helix-turn-helix domain-containing protein [Pseudomonadota bacterium]
MSDNGRLRVLEVNEAADLLGLRMISLFVYISQGKIKTYHNEGRFKIRDVDVEKFIEQRRANRANCGKPKLRRRAGIQDSEVVT